MGPHGGCRGSRNCNSRDYFEKRLEVPMYIPPPSAYLRAFAIVFATGFAAGIGLQSYIRWATKPERQSS